MDEPTEDPERLFTQHDLNAFLAKGHARMLRKARREYQEQIQSLTEERDLFRAAFARTQGVELDVQKEETTDE